MLQTYLRHQIQFVNSHSHQLLQQFNLLLTLLATTGKRQQRQWRQLLLEQVATNLLTIRSERSEQGVLKLRPKPYPRIQEPRSVLKAKLRARLSLEQCRWTLVLTTNRLDSG